jgi:Protein of unknown function (DUF1360)
MAIGWWGRTRIREALFTTSRCDPDMAVMARRTETAGPRLEEILVIALAAERVARAISLDGITAPWRERVERAADQPVNGRRRLSRLVSDLVTCPMCTGWWASLAVSVMWPGGYKLRRGLSVAGAQVLLTLAERLVSEQGRAVIRNIGDD